MIEFQFTPEEARSLAQTVYEYLRGERLTVTVEAPVAPDAPYATTLLAMTTGATMLVDVQHRAALTGALGALLGYCAVRRLGTEIYIATGEEGAISLELLRQLKREGIGLITVAADRTIDYTLEARNPALMITLDQTLALGRCRAEITRIVSTFNRGIGDRKSALREMSEVFEREIHALAVKASRKGYIDRTVAELAALRLANKIDILAAPARYIGGRTPSVSEDLRTELHSFRIGRNTVDHAVATRAAELRRQQQLPERMLAGPRLVAELLRLQRSIR